MRLNHREKEFEKLYGSPEVFYYFDKKYLKFPYCYFDADFVINFKGVPYTIKMEIDIYVCIRQDVQYEQIDVFAFLTSQKPENHRNRLNTYMYLLYEGLEYKKDFDYYNKITYDRVQKMLLKRIALEYYMEKVNEIQKLYNKGYDFKKQFDKLMIEINEEQPICFYDVIQEQLAPDYRDFILHYNPNEIFSRKLIKYVDDIHSAIIYVDARI